jgi:hypothetical protein
MVKASEMNGHVTINKTERIREIYAANGNNTQLPVPAIRESLAKEGLVVHDSMIYGVRNQLRKEQAAGVKKAPASKDTNPDLEIQKESTFSIELWTEEELIAMRAMLAKGQSVNSIIQLARVVNALINFDSTANS